jgi:hypothetical protein
MDDEGFVIIALTDGRSVDDVRAVAIDDVQALNDAAAQVDGGQMQWQIASLQHADSVIYFLNH